MAEASLSSATRRCPPAGHPYDHGLESAGSPARGIRLRVGLAREVPEPAACGIGDHNVCAGVAVTRVYEVTLPSGHVTYRPAEPAVVVDSVELLVGVAGYAGSAHVEGPVVVPETVPVSVLVVVCGVGEPVGVFDGVRVVEGES